MFYLKYRPQTIAELDNERIKDTLGKALLNNDWGHAYLLLGTRGSGKTTTARLIAKIVNCTDRKKGEDPCGKCDSCLAIKEGRSLDVIEIDAASNTGVEDIRELRERVKLAPVSSKYKVYIIDEVHMLSTSAFNALLKTLEEPPEHVIFVLATTDPQKLPATIVSRCLVYDFGKASKEEIISSLKRKIKKEELVVSDLAVEMIAQQASGSFRDADKTLEMLSMQSREITEEMIREVRGSSQLEETAKEILLKLKEKDSKKVLLTIEKFATDNGNVKLLMVELVDYLKSLLLLRNGIKSENEDISFTTSEISKLISNMIEANGFVRESPIAQLPLEMVVVEFCQIPVKEDGLKISGQPIKEKPEIRETASHPQMNTPLVEEKVVSEIKNVAYTAVVDPSVDGIIGVWTEVLNGIKPYNHNLSALLRSSRPKKLDKQFLTIEAFYKFHMDKLSEVKNREIVEKVISDLLGSPIKVKFELAEQK